MTCDNEAEFGHRLKSEINKISSKTTYFRAMQARISTMNYEPFEVL